MKLLILRYVLSNDIDASGIYSKVSIFKQIESRFEYHHEENVAKTPRGLFLVKFLVEKYC